MEKKTWLHLKLSAFNKMVSYPKSKNKSTTKRRETEIGMTC
jgi:hypothetical protein